MKVKVRLQLNPDRHGFDCVLDSDPKRFVVRGLSLHNLLAYIGHPRVGKTYMREEVYSNIRTKGYYLTIAEVE